MKGDKDGRPHHMSIPPKDAIAILPPKKVRLVSSLPACALAATEQLPHTTCPIGHNARD